MGAECSKLRQPMRAILALSRAQLLLIVVTRSRDLSRECHVTKHKTPARSNFPMSNFENFGTIQFSSSRSTSRGLCPKIFEKRAHPSFLLVMRSRKAGFPFATRARKREPCLQRYVSRMTRTENFLIQFFFKVFLETTFLHVLWYAVHY